MPDAPAGGTDAPVGGQAVLEGVMMKGPSRWAVAVRAPTAEQREAHPNGLPRGAAALGPVPASWLVREFLPQVRLLGASVLAVTHGGNNSVTEAMTAGVPLVTIVIRDTASSAVMSATVRLSML